MAMKNTQSDKQIDLKLDFLSQSTSRTAAKNTGGNRNISQAVRQDIDAAQVSGIDVDTGRDTEESQDRKLPCCVLALLPSRLRLFRALALVLTLLAVWGAMLSIEEVDATPRGQLFGLVILCVVAHIMGLLCILIKLPPLLGMLLSGILLRNVGAVELDADYLKVAAILRKLALAVILIRAGLGLDPAALRRLSLMVLLLSTVPLAVEAMTLMLVSYFLLKLPWLWGLMLGFVMSAVSPAVVIPCLFRLQYMGYGKSKGIPTLIIAAASLDDVIAVTGFGIVFGIIFSTENLTMKSIQGPLEIVIGGAFGIVWGAIARVVPQHKDPLVAPLRTILIAAGGFLAVLGSDFIGYDGAGPLSCIVLAFVACHAWRIQGWSDEQNPVAYHFKLVWVVFQTLLFALIGSEIDFKSLNPASVGFGITSISVALVCRIVTSALIASGGNLTWKERLFVAVAWVPKATVQAALGPLALDMVRNTNRTQEIEYAHNVLTLAVLGILLTAPTGSIAIMLLGPRLLSKSEMSLH